MGKESGKWYKGGFFTIDDKELVPNSTSGTGQDSGITITHTPTGHVCVLADGVQQELGDGVDTKDCYFESPGGDPRLIADIVAGDSLIWNGETAGFDLSPAIRIDLLYRK